MNLRFYLPQYWPTWFALALMRQLARRDLSVLLRLGQRLGDLAYRLPLPQKRVARRNLELAFPDWSAAQRERLLRQHLREVGLTLGETALAWFAEDERIASMVELEGLPGLDAAAAQGRGVIILAAHFTTLEIGVRFLTACRPIHAVFKPSKNQLLTELFQRHRAPRLAGLVASDDIRSMVRTLKQGGIVWYAPDQAYRGKAAERVDFFGHPVATNTATSRLAQLTGASVLPYFVERLPGASGYRARIGPPMEDFPGNSPQMDTARWHALIEAEIRRQPAQYLWLHKRFKDVAGGNNDYYGKS